MLGGDTSRNKIKVLSEKFMKIKYKDDISDHAPLSPICSGSPGPIYIGAGHWHWLMTGQ